MSSKTFWSSRLTNHGPLRLYIPTHLASGSIRPPRVATSSQSRGQHLWLKIHHRTSTNVLNLLKMNDTWPSYAMTSWHLNVNDFIMNYISYVWYVWLVWLVMTKVKVPVVCGEAFVFDLIYSTNLLAGDPWPRTWTLHGPRGTGNGHLFST